MEIVGQGRGRWLKTTNNKHLSKHSAFEGENLLNTRLLINDY